MDMIYNSQKLFHIYLYNWAFVYKTWIKITFCYSWSVLAVECVGHEPLKVFFLIICFENVSENDIYLNYGCFPNSSSPENNNLCIINRILCQLTLRWKTFTRCYCHFVFCYIFCSVKSFQCQTVFSRDSDLTTSVVRPWVS